MDAGIFYPAGRKNRHLQPPIYAGCFKKQALYRTNLQRWASGLLRLAKDYGDQRYEAACKRALPSGTFSYRLINSILTANLDQETPEQGDLFQTPPHNNLRGPDAYQ